MSTLQKKLRVRGFNNIPSVTKLEMPGLDLNPRLVPNISPPLFQKC